MIELDPTLIQFITTLVVGFLMITFGLLFIMEYSRDDLPSVDHKIIIERGFYGGFNKPYTATLHLKIAKTIGKVEWYAIEKFSYSTKQEALENVYSDFSRLLAKDVVIEII